MNKKILVGLSGGMDSAVAAALLKTQGYEVIGVHFQLWDKLDQEPKIMAACCSSTPTPDTIEKLCKELEISYHLVKVYEDFRYTVVDYIIHEALSGRLPNPCVHTNCRIKIAHLLKKAEELKCDYVATGHYAKVVHNADNTESNIYRATDRDRDQSHLLFDLKQNQLAKIMMPLGDLVETNIRKMANTFKVPLVEKPMTKSICYVDDSKYFEFIEKSAPDRYRPAGPIVSREGHILGRHNGLFRHRIGEYDPKGVEKPDNFSEYLIGVDVKFNAAIVGEEKELLKSGLVATNCNWIGQQDFTRGKTVHAKLGNNQTELAECQMTLLNTNAVLVEFRDPQRAIQLGQPIVFYQEDIMIGGAWIEILTEPVTTKLNKRHAYLSS